tara:strand:+ start:1415 stop:1549 length:135 start_codon:yes stop_codon:yes gene_type:complete
VTGAHEERYAPQLPLLRVGVQEVTGKVDEMAVEVRRVGAHPRAI